MIKIYTIKNKVNYTSEQIILFGLNKDCIPNQARFNGTYEACNKRFTYVDTVEEADIIAMPYKFKGVDDTTFKTLNILSINHKKPFPYRNN